MNGCVKACLCKPAVTAQLRWLLWNVACVRVVESAQQALPAWQSHDTCPLAQSLHGHETVISWKKKKKPCIEHNAIDARNVVSWCSYGIHFFVAKWHILLLENFTEMVFTPILRMLTNGDKNLACVSETTWAQQLDNWKVCMASCQAAGVARP